MAVLELCPSRRKAARALAVIVRLRAIDEHALRPCAAQRPVPYESCHDDEFVERPRGAIIVVREVVPTERDVSWEHDELVLKVLGYVTACGVSVY
eukprot:CAMPEP_0119200036 /NCGR_PEP_ID=MMETSP1316-20130426/24672_1 /TAXON_ID=41880 /ORGANISM="Pycnococcus provasolii, Strain RCC2336" /LENGTH=94 /DNA_ID=CAMNT_0007196069 /DNA_START=416 /DNA_END=700 /DNA_ORIENTATION=-